MTANIYLPEDWAAMKLAVYQFVRANVADPSVTVYQARQNAPIPPVPRVVVDHITNPITDGGMDEIRMTSCAVVVDTVADSTDYTVSINGTPYTHNSGAGATSISIRDGLIGVISHPGVTVQAYNDSALQVIPTNEITIGLTAELSLKGILRRLGNRIVTWSVDVTTDPQERDAVLLAAEIRDAIEADELFEALQQAGWAFVSIEGDRNLDDVVGREHRDRAGFDLRLRARSRKSILVDFIETATIGTDLGAPTP